MSHRNCDFARETLSLQFDQRATLWHSEIAHLCLSVEQDGARNTGHGLTLVGMARDLALADLNVVPTGIGSELRRLHSDVLREEIPDRMAELIKQLEQMEASPRG